MPKWQKGQSGNPAGRPRRHRPVIDIIGMRKREEMIRALADRAIAGDVGAARVLLERTDAALSKSELTGAEGRDLVPKAEAAAAQLTDAQLDTLLERLRDAGEPSPLGPAPNGNGNGSQPH